MSMKDHANNILNTIDDDLLAARIRRDEIEKAMEMLANADIPDDILNPLRLELDEAKAEVVELMVHRMLVRVGMRENHWLNN